MKIPNSLKPEIERTIDAFNAKHDCKYAARYKGQFLYLGRNEGSQKPSPICRLLFTGNIEKWEFAIYKYSTQSYDPDEWFFPGEQYVNGTIEGAMMAGLEAYA